MGEHKKLGFWARIWSWIIAATKAGVFVVGVILLFFLFRGYIVGQSFEQLTELSDKNPAELSHLESLLIEEIRKKVGEVPVSTEAKVQAVLDGSSFRLPDKVSVLPNQIQKQLVITQLIPQGGIGYHIFSSQAYFVGRYSAKRNESYTKLQKQNALAGLAKKIKKLEKKNKKKLTDTEIAELKQKIFDKVEKNLENNPGSKVSVTDPVTGEKYWNADLFQVKFQFHPRKGITVHSIRLMEFTPIGLEEEIISGQGFFAVLNSTNTEFYLKKNMFSRYRDSQSLKIFNYAGNYLGSASLTRMRAYLAKYFIYKKYDEDGNLLGPSLYLHYRGARSQKYDDYKDEIALYDLKTRWAKETSFLVFQKNDRKFGNPVLFLVNFIRDLPFVGPKPIAWLEEIYFNAKDEVKRWFNTESKEYTLKIDKNGNDILPPNQPNGDLSPIISDLTMEGEGVWTKHELDGASDEFYYETTMYRPDPARPFAVVKLLKIERRFFDLKMVGGITEPQSSTGVTGAGIIPEDPIERNKIFFVFSGGFKTFHSPSGMMVDNQIIRQPMENRGTLAIYKDGSLLVEDWDLVPNKKKLVSYRQNCPIILHKGTTNRYKRLMSFGVGWGLLVFTWRTGIGFNDEDKLVYAIGNSLSIYTLARAMKAAGVKNAMQLDINDFNIMASWYHPNATEEGKPAGFKTVKLDERVPGKANKFDGIQERDFMYLTFKDEFNERPKL